MNGLLTILQGQSHLRLKLRGEHLGSRFLIYTFVVRDRREASELCKLYGCKPVRSSGTRNQIPFSPASDLSRAPAKLKAY